MPLNTSRVLKAQDVLRRHGVGGVTRRFFDRVHFETRRRVWCDEHHVWHVLPLDRGRPRLALPEGLRLVEGDESHLYHLATIPATGELKGRDWLGRGARMFLVLDAAERAVFAGWVFRREVPIPASPRGLLALPSGVSALEGLFTASEHRGHGIAPSAYALIADRLEAEGDAFLVVTTEAKNASSRRALEKAGMRPTADMFTRRRLGIPRMRIEPRDEFGRGLVSLWTETAPGSA